MNLNEINSLASHIAAHWHSMNEEPKLGKMILVYHLCKCYEDMFKYINSPLKDPHLDNINCVPIDLNKYKISVGYLDKPNKGEKKQFNSNTRMFVAKDFMYEGERSFELKRAPFTALHFDKWIYFEEIMYL